MVGRVLFGVALALCLVVGCGGSGLGGGVLNQALNGTLPDQDADGLFDIAPPRGVPFDLDATLGTRIRSTITFADAEAAARVDIPDFVASWITAKITLLVTYEDGTTQTLDGVFSIRPFELVAEIACPVSVEARATVIANVPFLGPQTVASFGPFTVNRSGLAEGIECGATFEMNIFVNEETGLIEADVDVV